MAFITIDTTCGQFTFESFIFQQNILPLLHIYNTTNASLKSKVSEILATCSKHFNTPQNIEIFTSLCINLNITQESLCEVNTETFKRHVSSLVSKRETFNMIKVVCECFNGVYDANIKIDAWLADIHGNRGHDRIGEGEMFFSFFSRGKKNKSGDVCLNIVVPLTIEFKGRKGRLLTSQEICVTDNFIQTFLQQPKSVINMAIALCVIAGVMTSETAIQYMFDEICTPLINDVCNAINATNAIQDYSILNQRVIGTWSKKTKTTSLRSICGAIQLAQYKKNTSFDWLVLTNKETPYICKGFHITDNILANTLTILNNNILIQQNLDGKGYHISF